MPVPIMTEYGNQNRQRKFPFDDASTLADTTGAALPVDFIVDASLYPIDVTGPVYVSMLDPGKSTVYFADGAGKVFATAVYTQQDTADVVETGVYERKLGVLVFGAGKADVFRGERVRKFGAAATRLAPTACVPVQQAGVRGFILPDGTLMTGDVTITGKDGVWVTSRTEMGLNVLRFDVVGVVPASRPDCTTDGPPICTIIVQRLSSSPIMVSAYGNDTVAVTLRGLSLDELCAAVKGTYRRNTSDPCGDPVAPPSDPAPVVTEQLTFHVCDHETNAFDIVAPSSPSYVNPISIRAAEQAPAPQSRLTHEYGTDMPGIEKAADMFRQPPQPGGGIIMEIQGIGARRLPQPKS